MKSLTLVLSFVVSFFCFPLTATPLMPKQCKVLTSPGGPTSVISLDEIDLTEFSDDVYAAYLGKKVITLTYDSQRYELYKGILKDSLGYTASHQNRIWCHSYPCDKNDSTKVRSLLLHFQHTQFKNLILGIEFELGTKQVTVRYYSEIESSYPTSGGRGIITRVY